ncbi:LPS-assembly protein [Methylobacillus rhizosphaerae]|uniref:LPS-assembly protein LptD n=1 Tax=Methylobacillus rhizosphaerae TaxID=551994 RepID=A0A238Y2D0_9PROT|nr:LPS-assembly protein LptD [Methylobacillus rhizosphaerae]SNR65446.1 LPS-assembly protein [Methylobacillus rhizosphaerae]
MKIRPITFLTALVCLGFGHAHAETPSDKDPGSAPSENLPDPDAIVIEGDKIQVYLDRKLKSIGNASLTQDQQEVYGDTIEYDVQNEELHVIGNVRLETKGGRIKGPELRLNPAEGTGEMKQPTFELDNQLGSLPQFGISGNQRQDNDNLMYNTNATPLTQQNIEDSGYSPGLSRRQGASRGDASGVVFEGPDRKRLKDARYTTCEVGSDDWYIRAKELELDDYSRTGTARNARVEFQGVPILWTPWVNFSFMNQRKSGFLAPTWGTTSRSGFEFLMPFYWNIAPDMDATIGTRFLSKRGMQYQGEFRYLNEDYQGTANIEYLPSDTSSGENRYYAKFAHLHNFHNGWTAAYNLEKVSDEKYFSEMSTRIVTTSRVNLPQQAYVNYADENWTFNALVQKFQTLDGVNYPLQRLPQLTLTGDNDWGPFDVKLFTQWANFERNNDAIRTQSTLSGGTLDTLVTGKRLVAYPSISLPMSRPYGYITPKLGVHYTQYQVDNGDFTVSDSNGNITSQGIYQSQSRSLPIFSLDSGLYFERDTRVVNNRYTQTLEPRLYYVYIPYRDQSLIPVFDSSSSDLNMNSLFLENQFTGQDRINNANQLTLAVTSRLISKKTGEQRLAMTIGQRYYFADEKVYLPGVNPRSGDTSDIVGEISARLLNHWNLDIFGQYNTDRNVYVRNNINARYNPEPGKTLNIGYRYTEDRLEQINISGQWPLGKGWYGLGRWNYSLRENIPIEGVAGLEYDAGCWQARTVMQRVATATADANYALYFQLELGGLASIGQNPLKLLNRAIPGYTSSSLIPDSYQ